MGVTRRELFKGVLTAAALALVPSLSRLPKAAQRGRTVGRVAPLPLHTPKIWNRALSVPEILEQYDIQHVPFCRGSSPILDSFGIPSFRVRQRIEELRRAAVCEQ